VFGSAGASPSQRDEAPAEPRESGGLTGVRLSRSFALPKGRGTSRTEGIQRTDRDSAQQELRPPEGTRHRPNEGIRRTARCSAQRELRPPKTRNTTPSQRGQHPWQGNRSGEQDFALIQSFCGQRSVNSGCGFPAALCRSAAALFGAASQSLRKCSGRSGGLQKIHVLSERIVGWLIADGQFRCFTSHSAGMQ
jgi:hypothetical protein